MKKSVMDTANYVFKLHAAIITSWREKAYHNVFVYPVMDGAYITATNKEDMENLLIRVYRKIAEVFINEPKIEHQYLMRGAVAYGEVIHGHNVPYGASKAFELDLGYKNQILLGSAMIDAYEGEREAAPFGIYVHESAKNRFGDRYKGTYSGEWKWFLQKSLKVEESLSEVILNKTISYLDSMRDTNNPLHYDIKKIERHKRLAEQYFGKQ